MNATQLIEIATKVYVNREQEEEKNVEQRLKGQTELLAAALVKRETGIKPTVTVEIGGQQMNFMVDTSTEHSVVTWPIGPLSKNYVTITRANSVSEKKPFCQIRNVVLEDGRSSMNFYTSQTAQSPC
ncbi:hypothetical protein AAY473_019925 [Plecturocebus cupreus]